MKFILAKKQNMTQIFDETGRVIPVTVLSAGPVVVTAVKDMARDGYKAVQIGFGSKKEKRISKAVRGHLKGLGNFAFIKEFRINDDDKFAVGDKIDVSAFAPGDTLTISGISKGKGFQGVVKRHGFHGGPRSHGQKHSEREPGSISGGVRNGGRVPLGMRMAGRTGSDRITIKSSKVVAINLETNEMLVSGPVPGRRGTMIELSAK
jgi:large subunit ribosomal protein L3